MLSWWATSFLPLEILIHNSAKSCLFFFQGGFTRRRRRRSQSSRIFSNVAALSFRGPTSLQGAPLAGSTRTQSRGWSLRKNLRRSVGYHWWWRRRCSWWVMPPVASSKSIFTLEIENPTHSGDYLIFCGLLLELLAVLRQAFSWCNTLCVCMCVFG